MNTDIIDFVNLLPFHESQYIGQGKTFPSDIPPHIADAVGVVLQIPQNVARFFPDPELPVAKFITHALPTISHAIIPVKIKVERSHY